MSCTVCRSLLLLTNSWTVICSSGHQGYYKHVTATVHLHLRGPVSTAHNYLLTAVYWSVIMECQNWVSDTVIDLIVEGRNRWWRYGISRHCDEWKYIIIGRIFESEIVLIPPSLKTSESSSNGSYRNTDEVWWRYGISRSCDRVHDL
jgi:hypothetical protein